MAAFPLGGNFMPPNLAATQLLMQASTSNPKDLPPVSMAALTRLPAMPDLPPLPQAYLPAHLAALNAAAFTDPRLIYSALSGGLMGNPEMKEGPDAMAAWRHIAAQANAAAAMGGAPMPPYDSHMAPGAGFPFPGYAAIDLNGTRRKNATRETTSTLKAWLYEHRKNPYPNKGEKIMLAIMTKMTLTQVSTWFANARRRLKKENKMTWSPRNRTEDGSDDGEDKEENENVDDDLSIDLSDFDAEGKPESSDESKSQRTSLDRQKSVPSSTEGPISTTRSTPEKESKPKIWSLADVAANPTKHQSIHSQSVRHKPYHIPSPNPAGFRPWFEAQANLNRQLHPAALAALQTQLNPAFMMTARPTVPSMKHEHLRQAGTPEGTGSNHRLSTISPHSTVNEQKERLISLNLTTQSHTEDNTKE